MNCPVGLNSMTDGAGMQHSESGGFNDAPRSLSGILPGRWKTQMLSCESTAMPPTAPVAHLFGSAWKNSGSGSNVGAFRVDCASTRASEPAIRPTTNHQLLTTHFLIGSPAPSVTRIV